MPEHQQNTMIASASERARRVGLHQSSIAKALGASQSQVSRVFSGKTSAQSKLAKDICIYVLGSTSKSQADAVRANEELIGALAEVWNGTPAHARALAVVIRSLALLSPPLSTDEATS